MKKDLNDDMDTFWKQLQKATPQDFDGHTEFHRLTVDQKLLWLSQCSQFCVEHTGKIIQ